VGERETKGGVMRFQKKKKGLKRGKKKVRGDQSRYEAVGRQMVFPG